MNKNHAHPYKPRSSVIVIFNYTLPFARSCPVDKGRIIGKIKRAAFGHEFKEVYELS